MNVAIDQINKKLGLELKNEEIERLSNNKFKNISTFETAEYLVDNRFFKAEAQLLFKLEAKL